MINSRLTLYYSKKLMNSSASSVFDLAKVVTVTLLLCNFAVFAQTPQEHVHQMSRSVMPFDMQKTIHIFKMTESGGVERVIARDPNDIEQVVLIQQHLKHEAKRFQHGDYSDPATLHGTDMAGLKELQAGAAGIKISYTSLSAGAEITFQTTDIHLLTAIHRWFGAQLSEHGADARAE